MRSKTLITGLMVTAFVAAIAVPFLGYYAVHGSTPERVLRTENRNVVAYKELASLKNGDLKDYYGNLDRYIADRLMSKDEVVEGTNLFFGDPKYFFKIDLDRGMIGEDGFVFLGNSNARSISRHFDRNYRLNADIVERALNLQETFQKVSNAAGAPYVLFLAPDKHGVYCKMIPAWLKDDNSCMQSGKATYEMIERLKVRNVHAVYPLEALRNEPTTYFKTDSHWNLKGSGVGFRELMEDLKSRESALADMTLVYPKLIEREDHSIGGLKGIVGLPNDFPVDDVTYSMDDDPMVEMSDSGGPFTSMKLSQIEIKGWMDWVGEVHNPSAPNQKRIVVICDSFMIAMSMYFSLNFSNVYYMSRHCPDAFLLDNICRIKPDLVVYENVERDFPLL